MFMQPGPLRPMCRAVAGVKETFMLPFICNFCFFTGTISPLLCHPFVERLARPCLTHHFPQCERGGEDVGGGRAEGRGGGRGAMSLHFIAQFSFQGESEQGPGY